MSRSVERDRRALVVDDPDFDAVDGLAGARCPLLHAVGEPADRGDAGLGHSPGRNQLRAQQPARPTDKLRRDRRAAADETAERRRSEEHTSELQSPMRISYAVFCLKTKKKNKNQT